MKYFILLLAMASFHVNAAEPIAVTVNPKQPTFEVSLPANPSTGYQWQVKKYDANLFTMTGSAYAPVQNSNVIGASGKTTFTFKLVKNVNYPQESMMTFYYFRPWEPKSGSSQVVYIYFKEWD